MNEIAGHGVHFGRIAAMLPARDMGTSHDFYTRVLGFQKVFENGNPVGLMIPKRDQGRSHLTMPQVLLVLSSAAAQDRVVADNVVAHAACYLLVELHDLVVRDLDHLAGVDIDQMIVLAPRR